MNVGLRLGVRPLGISHSTATLVSPICRLLTRRPAPFAIDRGSLLTLDKTRAGHRWSNSRFPFPRNSRAKYFCLVGIATVGIHTYASSTIECQESPPRPPAPESIVNVYELSFGTAAGICAGVFIKKGAKAVAFFVGGIFVLLQYFGSLSLVRVDWARMSQKFERLFYTVAEDGSRRAPTISSLWNWLVDFLIADFQPRATFLAGLMLGLRIG